MTSWLDTATMSGLRKLGIVASINSATNVIWTILKPDFEPVTKRLPKVGTDASPRFAHKLTGAGNTKRPTAKLA